MISFFVLVWSYAGAQAQDTITGVKAFEIMGVDFDTIEVRVETLAPGFHVLFGAGGNVAVSIGDQGVLIVDDQFPTMVPKIRAAVRSSGNHV
jgi:hypothetical protein